jgi:hypothetical protein
MYFCNKEIYISSTNYLLYKSKIYIQFILYKNIKNKHLVSLNLLILNYMLDLLLYQLSISLCGIKNCSSKIKA